MGSTRVKYVYYSILSMYAVWGLFVLWRLPALDIAKIGAVLGNVALGFSALHALYANRALLPKPLRPHWLLQLGVVLLRNLLHRHQPGGSGRRGQHDCLLIASA